MTILKKEIICPFCFNKHDLFKIQFRCQNSENKCAPDFDNIYADFRGIPPEKMKRVYDIPQPKSFSEKLYSILFIPKKLACPYCNMESTDRICPSCHSDLPYTIGEYNDLIFSMIGAKESGKSHYISVLINTIQNQIGSNFSSVLDPVDDNTRNKYRKVFYDPIYRRKEVIPETKSARSDYNVKSPLVYTLSFLKKSIIKQEKKTNVSTISFFDTAGEDLNAEETLKTENKYIYNSSGIILLIDPLQIQEVRDKLIAEGIKLPRINAESEDIISRVARLIRTANDMKMSELIDIPIAVAFSKIDALENIIDRDSFLYTPSGHNGYFNKKEAISIATEIENFLVVWAGQYVISQVKNNFKYYSFFGVSALGSNPHGTNKIEKLRPHRVEDPFLWLLYKNKIIFTSKFGEILRPKNLRKIAASILVAIMMFAYYSIYPLSIKEDTNSSDYEMLQTINYSDIIGDYYGLIAVTDDSIRTMYLKIEQSLTDSTFLSSYLKYDIRKEGVTNKLKFIQDSSLLLFEGLGAGIIIKDTVSHKIIIKSDSKNKLRWELEK